MVSRITIIDLRITTTDPNEGVETSPDTDQTPISNRSGTFTGAFLMAACVEHCLVCVEHCC